MSLDISTAAGGGTTRPDDAGLDAVLALARQRRRLSLGSAAVLLAVFMGYIVLTTSTTVLSGRLGGLGIAYWVGFAVFAAILVVAQIYTRWARRMDAVVDAHLAALEGR
ncbi:MULTISPECIES: DUF485 domain-containing protein [Rhodococcus]|jgi:uncharacterized membrane protein (DUF485 family)|uniref:DUF485 domain-containing protein n=1 Tax=Rhodococcus aetherivorans TaxID=191292 RepID=A0AA46NZ60_9NOCA|nr:MULTISPECIES: DUF485 domain-containing protein [Rhodococcus]NCL74106.1 hypothetical protein [Rhodococcus sp. YH1]AKE92804.1 hypothetical protein AAT18_24135 [Rhodococcus aetherivorans]ANZ27869.1 hypothetical protein A4U64_00425 [Rhodococcus sp. WB1]MDV6295829.1 DUF485 domain-containing protein [Rhodococcus aetherivorans]OLL21385.1 hypothetical protein BKE56_004975 [Rhodococcus sp. M8]